jgi:hypothetical protein
MASTPFKVVLLGEGCVGKTSLVLRYCQNTFNDKHLTTLQVSALSGHVCVGKLAAFTSFKFSVSGESSPSTFREYSKGSTLKLLRGACLFAQHCCADDYAACSVWIRPLYPHRLGARLPSISEEIGTHRHACAFHKTQ